MAQREQNKPQKVTPIIIDGFEINAQNVSFQKLQEFSLTLFEKLLHQRKERNYLMLERDKLRTILESIHHDIKVAKHTAFNKEKELELTQAKNRQEIKEVDQEVKYILYDHNIHLSELSVWEGDLLTKTNEKHFSEELELLTEKRTLKEKLTEQTSKHEEELINLKNEHIQEIVDLKHEQEVLQIEHEVEYRRNVNNTIELLTLKHEMEMSEVEERKNTHLNELKLIHKTRLDEMKNFFNSITSENLTVIFNLKQYLDGMKKNKSVLLSELKSLKQENKKLKDPLNKSKAEVKNLTRQLVNYEKDLLSLKINKRMLKETLEEIRNIKKHSGSVLRKIKSNDKYEFLNSLERGCFHSIKDFKDNTIQKKVKLEETVKLLLEDVRNKNKLIKELSDDPDIHQALQEMHFEFWNPQRILYELALICKAHDDLLRTLEGKLEEFCVVREVELGVKSLDVPHIGSGPASLVSKQQISNKNF